MRKIYNTEKKRFITYNHHESSKKYAIGNFLAWLNVGYEW